jgi:hypothetical protein
MARWLCLSCVGLLAGCSRDTSLPPPPGPGTVYGRVVVAVPGQPTPAAAPGALVSILGTSASTTAGSDGSFLLDDIELTQGSLLFQVGPDGSGTYSRQTLISLAAVGAGPGRQISLGDVAVGANAQIHGRVLLGDKVGMPGGQAGSTVFVPAAPYSAVTNDDGTFTLANLPSGSLQVSMFHPAYQATSIGAVNLSAGESYDTADVILTPAPGTQQPGTLSGSIILQPALANATGTSVSVATPGTTVTPVATQADGTFSLPNLAPALYDVTVTHSGYTSATVDNVLVQPGNTVDLPQILLTTTPATDAGQGSGPTDAGGGPGTPVASAGPPGAVRVDGGYTLDGTGSADPSGETLSYAWIQTAGTPVGLSINGSVLASRPSFVAPGTPQNLGFTLTVTNTSGASASASTTVAVVAPPVALVSPASLTLRAGEQATLDGSASFDPTGTPVSYAWSQPSGNLTLTGSGSHIQVTASASGISVIDLVVSNGFVSSDAFPVTVATGVNPTVSVNAGSGQTVATGGGVILAGSATSSDPNDTFAYQWTQTQGPSVTLFNASDATSSFQAPGQAASLQFLLTATTDAGSSSATVGIDVVDLTPPVIVAMTPDVDGGVGPWAYASATFDKALDPASVSTATVSISASGAALPSALTYDPASFTVKVLPNAPLVAGASYTFFVGAVTDDTPQHNVHVPVSIEYVAATPQWNFWASGISTQLPEPGVAVTPNEVDVFARRTEGGCTSGTWIMNPGADGGLVDQAYCAGIGNTGYPVGHMGVVANGIVYGFMVGECGSCVAGTQAMFSDGLSLLGPSTGYNGYFTLGTFNTTCSSDWCYETIDPTTGEYDELYMSGAALPGRGVAAASRQVSTYFYLVLYERGMPGTTWAILDGGQGGGSLDWSTTQIPSRTAYAHGDPFVAYTVDNPTAQLSGAAWRSDAGNWTPYTGIATGNVGDFDVVARGDTVWLAYVVGGQLYLSWMDLGVASPAFVSVVGPTGTSLNNGTTCTAGHPELSVTDDSVWVTWQETCSANTWQVFLRQMD